MTTAAIRQSPKPARDHTVAIMLNGGRVTATFREALFDATAREGISVNEFCLQAAAEKLKAAGRTFSGVFHPGDLPASSRNIASDADGGTSAFYQTSKEGSLA